MQEQILEKLRSNSFKEYCEGIKMLSLNIKNPELFQTENDQELMERICVAFIPEKWASHDDFVQGVKNIVTGLPDYFEYINDPKIGANLRGISIFIEGLMNQKYDLSAFKVPSHTGYLMSYTAAKSISKHFRKADIKLAQSFFKMVSNFFLAICDVQAAAALLLSKIRPWNKEMCEGFFNILTAADLSIQHWMLETLHNVYDKPVVKEHIFGRYIQLLENLKSKYTEEGKEKNILQVQEIMDMVIRKSKGILASES